MAKKLEHKLEETIMSKLDQHMDKSLQDLSERIKGLRTNRANPDMIKNIQVNYYGSIVPLQQVASISTPDASQFSLNVFDQNAVKEIEKAISNSSLNLTPQTEGNTIRIILPELTQDRRAQLVKLLKEMGENAKIAIRNIRKDAMDTIKLQEKENEFTEDDVKREQTLVQNSTNTYTEKIESLIKEKEKELLTL